MSITKDRIGFLGFFPLRTVVFPSEKLKLHVFEPRYKQLINDCLKTGSAFGIPPLFNKEMCDIGTEVTVINVFGVDDQGNMDILTEGRRIFRVVEILDPVPDKLYSGGQVVFLEEEFEERSFPLEELQELFKRFHVLLQTGYIRDNFESHRLSFQLAQEVGLTLEQKIKLLSITSENERLEYIFNHLKTTVTMLEIAETVKKRIKKNGKPYDVFDIEI